MIGNFPDGVELEDRPCPLGCAPKHDEPVLIGRDLLHGISGTFTVVRCVHCELMRTNPRPTASTIGAYYPSDYAPYASTVISHAQGAASARWRRWLKSLLELDSRRIPDIPPGRALEIGCAAGSFLAELRNRGWTVEGIEFSEAAAGQARRAGLSVQCATVENARAPDLPVDLVAAWMVLEHLHEPLQALRRIRNWVNPRGYFVASIPDASSRLERMFGARSYNLQVPTHLYHYTPRTIEKMLSAAGWRIERIAWQRNCSSPLRSFGYWATDRSWPRLAAASEWIVSSRKAAKLRAVLNLLAGLTRQSGRIEIWARPK